MSFPSSDRAHSGRNEMPQFQSAYNGVATAMYSRSQVALAEQIASQQAQQNQAAMQMAAWQEKETQLSNEIRKLRISSEKEIKGLRHSLEKALQDRAVLEVQVDALRASSDVSQVEAKEEADSLRKQKTELECQRDALARANSAMQQQAQALLASRGSARVHDLPPSQALQGQVAQLMQDRAMLLAENQRLWREVEDAQGALAYKAALRAGFCHGGLVSSPRSAPLQLAPRWSNTSSQLTEEEALVSSLRQAGAHAESAVQRAVDSARASPVSRCPEAPMSPGAAAESVRQQVQRDRSASVSCSVSTRMLADASTAPLPVGADDHAALVQHAQLQLDGALAHMHHDTAQAQGDATCRRMRTSGSFQKRLSPSVPTAPSRHNSIVERQVPPARLTFTSSRALHRALAPSVPSAPSRRNSVAERQVLKGGPVPVEDEEDALRVHFDKYADPSTFDVPPPATPHPSKGVLNPPQSPRSPAAAGASEPFWSQPQSGSHAVMINAASPRCYAQPALPTPHTSHGVLYHGDDSAGMQRDHAGAVEDLRTPDRSVSFQVGQGPTGSATSAPAGDGYHVMRSLDRSPGCTPIVSGAASGRVRMHSRPGHDNFAPLKSGTASPGGTPHARGQGRLPSVRVSPLAAAGHDQFNPLRSQVASPGCTPVRSVTGSVADGSDFDTILPYAPAADSAAVAPVAPSDDTTHTDAMHVVVVTGPGHDNFNPVHIPSRSPGHTPPHSGMLDSGAPPTVRISSTPGHDSFAPVNAGHRSPGHTPMPPRAEVAARPRVSIEAAPGHDGFAPMTAGQRSPGHTPRTSALQQSPHADHVTFLGASGHDGFQPMAATNASPGHTPRPSMNAAIASPMHVQFQSEPGHDQFHPIQALNSSPGHTPRRASDYASQGMRTTLPDTLSQEHGKRVSIDADVPHSHDRFQPMRMANESPGQTPRIPGHLIKGGAADEADMSGVSDAVEKLSWDGGNVPTSVRDAALRALQSSDSIRRRLISTGSNSDDMADDATSGATGQQASVQSHPLPQIHEDEHARSCTQSPRHADFTNTSISVSNLSPQVAAAPSDMKTPQMMSGSDKRVRRSVSVAGRFPLPSAASFGNRTSQSTSFSFLSPADHPCGDTPGEESRTRLGFLGMPLRRSGSLVSPAPASAEHCAAQRLSMASGASDGEGTHSAMVKPAPPSFRPRSAVSASGSSALVIQPLRSMRDCSHSSQGQQSTGRSQQGSVCDSERCPAHHK
eukprot:jgi/Ulvmu1/4991/UM021_0008.1